MVTDHEEVSQGATPAPQNSNTCEHKMGKFFKTERETWTEKIKGTKENKKQGNVTALKHSNNKQQSNEDKRKQGLSVYKGNSSKVKTVKD